MQNFATKVSVAIAVLATSVLGAASLASAQAVDPSDTVGTEITGVGTEALGVWPAALAAGIALMAVVVVIGFGKRIFRRSN